MCIAGGRFCCFKRIFTTPLVGRWFKSTNFGVTRTCNISDFLQVFPTISSSPQTKDWSGVSLESELTSGGILRTISLTVDRLQEELRILPEACESGRKACKGEHSTRASINHSPVPSLLTGQRPTVEKPLARPNPSKSSAFSF